MLDKINAFKKDDRNIITVAVDPTYYNLSNKTRKFMLSCLRSMIDAEIKITETLAPKKCKILKFPVIS